MYKYPHIFKIIVIYKKSYTVICIDELIANNLHSKEHSFFKNILIKGDVSYVAQKSSQRKL